MPGADIHLSHFAAMVVFALCVSVSFACLGRQSIKGRIKYAVLSLALFMVIGVGIAWLMYPFSK